MKGNMLDLSMLRVGVRSWDLSEALISRRDAQGTELATQKTEQGEQNTSSL